MGLTALPKISQFSNGDDLWVFSDLKNSNTLKKMDWFLNFQLQNNSSEKKQPTLIYSHKKLPTKGVLSIPFNGDIQSWCKTLKNYWLDLGMPRLRVFAPDQVHDIAQLIELDQNNYKINVVIN